MPTRRLRLSPPYDLRRTLQPLSRGGSDPSFRFSDGTAQRATNTPQGPATVALVQSDGAEVTAEAWGPGAEWVLEHADDLVGAGDDPASFVAHHGITRMLHQRFGGLRFMRSLAVFETLVPVIIEQRVIVADAHQAHARLVRKFGERAPGDLDLLLPPLAATLGEANYVDFHVCGIERGRAEPIRFAARRARRIDECAEMSLADAHDRLGSLPGVGPWTVAHVAGMALGDADAVPTADVHLPNMVCYALAGEPRGSDERMLELLEPYRGHRGRVIRYLGAGGAGAPRRGPRLARQDISRT